ncbi:hypothetical protein [Microbacterium sp. K24]|uniref:hypothetical protein n=1 Tax=Microbacterium sp. K24 TaxID=2305446 RepID=UPI00109C8A61|nr:hypothetical protein [Microbacterium sp. K24]
MSIHKGDYVAWAEYVVGESARFYDHCEGVTYIFADTPAAKRYLARCATRGASSEEAAFTGAWHVVRKLVTTEFRQWVEEYEATERLTFSQWRERAKEERVEASWEESADRALDQLEMLRRLISERDSLILEAARKGATKVAIARAVGLSRQQVHTVIAEAELAAVVVPDVAPFDSWEELAAQGAF